MSRRHDPTDHDCRGGVKGDRYPMTDPTPDLANGEEARAIIEDVALLTEADNDSSPLLDWLPVELSDRIAAFLNPKEPPNDRQTLADPAPLDVERLRDGIAGAVWAGNPEREPDIFVCTCDPDATCWPHEEADAVIETARLAHSKDEPHA